jgi:hypothetical protein
MPETGSFAADLTAPDDLISFLKAIPDGRYRRGVRYPQWFLMLVAVLETLSGCRSSSDLEAFAKRHRDVLNQALGVNFKPWPSDATFLYLFNTAHLQQFGEVLQARMITRTQVGPRVWTNWFATSKPCELRNRDRRRQPPVRGPGHCLRPSPWGGAGPGDL